MNEFSKLKDVSKLITKGTTPTSVGGSFTEKGINFIKSESITGSKFLNNSVFAFIDDSTDLKLKRSRIKTNDLLFSIAGAYLGKISIVQECDVPANTNQAVGIVRVDQSLADVNYLYYYFFQNSVNEYINKLSSQSSQPNLNLELLGNLEFKSRKLESQQKIATVLSALDDKIELNNQINTELEAMAKTLYDYWFVQFDFPDENGKPYKSSCGKMVFNETLKREIPVGWEVKKVEELVSEINTGLNPRTHFKLGEGDNFYITIRNIEYGILNFTDSCDRISDVSLQRIQKRSRLEKGDILFTSIEPVGKTYLLREKPINWNINESVFSIKPNYELVTSEFLFMLLSSFEMKLKCKNSSTGSIHKGIRINPLKEFCFSYAGVEIQKSFSDKIKPILDRIDLNQKQNQELAQLRDWLLPMLMNGQVRVGSGEYESEEESLGMVGEEKANYQNKENIQVENL